MKLIWWFLFAVFFTFVGFILNGQMRATKIADYRKLLGRIETELRLMGFQTMGMTSADLRIYQHNYIATVKACVEKMKRLIEAAR